jgi:hypothetical protein
VIVPDTQLLPICLSILLPLSMLIYSNSRVSDVRSTIGDAKDTLRAEMNTMRAEMKLDFERLTNKVDHLADLMATHLDEHHKH